MKLSFIVNFIGHKIHHWCEWVTANYKAGDINSVYGLCENQEQFQVLRFTMKLKCVGGGRLLFHLSASLLFIDC